jgi:hypothetical protein
MKTWLECLATLPRHGHPIGLAAREWGNFGLALLYWVSSGKQVGMPIVGTDSID